MQSRLIDNLAGFARLLRGAGLTIGSEQLAQGVRALGLVGLRDQSDFYWALAASLVTRPEHKPVFDQAFDLFWRAHLRTNPVAELSVWRRDDTAAGDDDDTQVPLNLLLDASAAEADAGDKERATDQRESAAANEHLNDKHFDRMNVDELAAVKQRLGQLLFDPAPYLARRRERSVNGDAIDWRRSLRSIPRNGGTLLEFARNRRREEEPTLVLLCDISGSMQIYSRVLLHFVCAVAQRRKHTHAFLFGTQLTNVSRYLGGANIDATVDRITGETRDFDGGTRIGAALAEFNKQWSRRLLSRRSIVILVSDGLDGEDSSTLEHEVDRLHRSCRHLMWLNPLLRFSGFEAKASGIKAILRHVDSVHAIHSLRHVGDVAAALATAVPRRGVVKSFV